MSFAPLKQSTIVKIIPCEVEEVPGLEYIPEQFYTIVEVKRIDSDLYHYLLADISTFGMVMNDGAVYPFIDAELRKVKIGEV